MQIFYMEYLIYTVLSRKFYYSELYLWEYFLNGIVSLVNTFTRKYVVEHKAVYMVNVFLQQK